MLAILVLRSIASLESSMSGSFCGLFSFTYRHSGLALRIRLRLGIELTVNQLEGGLTPKRNPSKSLAIRVRVRVRVTW